MLPRRAPPSPRARSTWCAARASRKCCSRTRARSSRKRPRRSPTTPRSRSWPSRSGTRTPRELAKAILREEKRMAGFLEKLIPRLTKSVVQAEIPRGQRNGGRRRTTSRSTTSRRKTTTATHAVRARRRRQAHDPRTQRAAKTATSRSRSASTRSRTTTGRARSTSRKTTGAQRPRAARTRVALAPPLRRCHMAPPDARSAGLGVVAACSPSRTGRGTPPVRSR